MLQDSKIMWRRIVAQAEVRKASRAAISLVGPLVANSRRRLNGIPASVWADPYVIGLTIATITIAARLGSATVEGQLLCKVQQNAWAKITGERAALIGEEVLLLSTARHPDFVLGCHDALDFGPSFYRFYRGASEVSDYRAAVDGGLDWPENIMRDNTYASIQDQIWARYFDAHCMR